MEEEFQESEIIFTENVAHDETKISSNSRSHRLKRRKKERSSVPVNIPENISGNSWFQNMDSDLFDDDNGELVPPHVIVGRRILNGKMAFSVCSGNGRTLKGRDLSQVRNSILRMTGFLET